MFWTCSKWSGRLPSLNLDPLTFLVVQPEGLLEFLLHGLIVFLNDELGGQRHELLELEPSGFCKALLVPVQNG